MRIHAAEDLCQSLAQRFDAVRGMTFELARPLSAEDMQLQSMPDCSPTKWHLAHTSWFFEEFVLQHAPGYVPADPAFRYLFNSYYDAVGARHPRPARGLLSRPSAQEVLSYRAQVDVAVRELLRAGGLTQQQQDVLELGLHHEQQHQELILTDILHALSRNPLRPRYAPAPAPAAALEPAPALQWIPFGEGVFEVGAGSGFSFDNERPRHRVFVEPFALSSRLVTAGEYLEFIRDGGYTRAELWMSEGLDLVRAQGLTAPLYWTPLDGGFTHFGLHGERPLDLAAPVTHLCWFEADAYARWAQARLPTEFEWERAAQQAAGPANLLESRAFEARAAPAIDGLSQMFGDLWEWTSSSYGPYPGYAPLPGALGEYNGKFMSNQYVLRGGSFATARSHLRASYRNFFPASARWQFAGLRLARSNP